jgi:hypothetical protein
VPVEPNRYRSSKRLIRHASISKRPELRSYLTLENPNRLRNYLKGNSNVLVPLHCVLSNANYSKLGSRWPRTSLRKRHSSCRNSKNSDSRIEVSKKSINTLLTSFLRKRMRIRTIPWKLTRNDDRHVHSSRPPSKILTPQWKLKNQPVLRVSKEKLVS